MLIFLFYQDALSNIRQSVNSLVKVNVVFLRYVRRMNQIDATSGHETYGAGRYLEPNNLGGGQILEADYQAALKRHFERHLKPFA